MNPLDSLLNTALVNWRFGHYGICKALELHNTRPWQRAQDYRRTMAAQMTSLDKRKLGSLPPGSYHLSRKMDGEFTVLSFAKGQAYTVNPGGTVRIGLPLLDEAAELLKRAGVRSCLIAGELYLARSAGQRERVHDVSHVARNPATIEDLAGLRFAAFDILEIDGQTPPSHFVDVYARLQKLFAGGTWVHPVESAPQPVHSVEEIERYFQRWVDAEGAEGLVLRSDNAGRYKLKNHYSLDVAVIGFSEALDERKGMLHDLLVAMMRQDGSLQVIGHVGTGFSDAQRRDLLSDLKDLAASSDYIESSPAHIAYQMVRPEIVVEVQCLDVLSSNTRGASIDRMTLHFDSAQGRYSPLRRLPAASLISPVFLRRRPDKQVNRTDVRLAQLGELCEIAKLDADPRSIALPPSQLLRRQVYTKSLKGQTLVRKLILFQTNKESSGDFPAYVLHLTDFSPTRKDPLQREIRVSNVREQIESKWTELYNEYIVRGWNRV